MTTQVELQQMLELALATPEASVVNFNVLRSFLLEIIKHIEVQQKLITVTEDGDHKSVYEAIRDAASLPQSRLSEGPSPTEVEPATTEKPSPPRIPSTSSKQSLG